MIPSLVATELRSALVEYLATTFALTDDDVHDELRRFLTDDSDGIFRGPFLRVRTPFLSVDEHWRSPLENLPASFVPYKHQATAFERLSSVDGRVPEPTLVTTGTGSGKTECFLLPVLDHCARMREAGQSGIKAIILYPMNALASDQAGRIAELIHNNPAYGNVTAGIYVGENGKHTSMGEDHLINKREALHNDPPDILLTNYKMLDFLLLRRSDRKLWQENESDTLQYIVLDEFHTYDGAQGTDVAMLLRRLGAALGMDDSGRPLGSATPVATSATMGSGPSAGESLCEFAGKVFGVPFGLDSLVGETRKTVEASMEPIDFTLNVPDPIEVAQLTDVDEIASAFCSTIGEDGEIIPWVPADAFDLGERLLQHTLTRTVLAAVGDISRSWNKALDEVLVRLPEWSRSAMRDRDAVGVALAKYVQLLSVARRPGWKTDGHPLFSIEVQLWIREVSRVLRSVERDASFRWRDSAAPDDDDGETQSPFELPATFCRNCGHSGWMAVQSEMGDTYLTTVNSIYEASLKNSPTQRVMLRCSENDPQAQWYDPAQRRIVSDSNEWTVPVHVTPDDDHARDSRCPTCDERRSIRFLGLQVASLASVSLNTMFSSDNVADNERKIIAFTDSVQDASHRASFFAGRTYRINLRSLMSRVLVDAGSTTLADLGNALLDEAATPQQIHSLVPPDLLRDRDVRTLWSDIPNALGRELLARRLAFETQVEFGLRSRVGRTLELSGAAVAEVVLDNYDECVDLLNEHLISTSGTGSDQMDRWVNGVLERLRIRGGVLHEFLDEYVQDNGRQWHIWGGRASGMPPFTPGQSRPVFPSTASKGDFDSLSALSSTPTWSLDWARRTLDLEPAKARDFVVAAYALLARHGGLVEHRTPSGTVYGINPANIHVHDVADSGCTLSCDLCGQRHPVVSDSSAWIEAPCLRYTCGGRYKIRPNDDRSNYYRDLYRRGITRRVVAGEHTGLLNRDDREQLEKAFKEGTAADAPNVLTATPTLEMGIDIGDLSAVMLTSVPPGPANYIQRVGRAGRATGNSLVTTFAGSDSHSLYYLSEPEAMISGEVRAPNCYLDAGETLERQYNAYLIDRIADRTIRMDDLIEDRIGNVMDGGMKAGGLFHTMAEASMLDPAHIERFLRLFGDNLSDATVERLTEYASTRIEVVLKTAVESWLTSYREIKNRRDRLDRAAKKLEEATHRTATEEEDLQNIKGQRKAVALMLRGETTKYTLTELEALSLLPNYTLIDDATKLTATMWSQSETGEFEIDEYEYSRSSALAVREFAPSNWFYAGGHRHVVDALEIGAADQPLYETWRLCPDCGYGVIDVDDGEKPESCPRCVSTAIVDTGTLQTMLKLRRSFASSSEEAARVYDERDERQRVFYDVVTTVDVDPIRVEGAWELEATPFGAEFAEQTRIRTINLGYSDRPGAMVPIAGEDRHRTGFSICRHCGASSDAREQVAKDRPERNHHGWCKVRSGALKEEWDSIVLYHQLETDAVRMVLPISMFEVTERLASFKGALLLGLRADFGGDPDHLQIISSDMPNRGGQGRLQFLVLYDRVPGGTGYLSRLADPERVKQILEAGLEVLIRCPCRAEGRRACHRCLLGVVDRHEYDHVSRDLAATLIDDLLKTWGEPRSIEGGTVAGIDIARIEESELERRFKVAMQVWASKTENVSMTPVAAKVKGRDAFEIRIGEGDNLIRYRMEEQEGLSTTPSTTPDFIFRRTDERAPEVAVYLDGYQFHASSDINNIADDATKRAAVRESGRWIWNMVWSDVAQFHEAIGRDNPRPAPNRSILQGSAKSVAKQIQNAESGRLDYEIAEQNPMSQLLSYLKDPDDAAWNRLARSVIGGGTHHGAQAVDASAASAVLDAAAKAEELPEIPAVDDSPLFLAAQFESQNGLRITALLDDLGRPEDEDWTVFSMLPDSAADVATEQHPERWHDWHQWANLLQFLGPVGSDRCAVIAATSQAGAFLLDPLRISRHMSSVPIVLESRDAEDVVVESAKVSVSDEMMDELDLLEEDNVRELVLAVLARGGADFTSGLEDDEGSPIEAAWPDQGVGVSADGVTHKTSLDVRPASEWPIDDLIDALKGTN